MGSEVRRAAGALVARREERFTTKRAQPDASERLERALEPMRFSRVTIEREWREGQGGPELVVRLAPVPSLEKWLRAASLALIALIAAAAWAISSESISRSVGFLVPLAAGLAIFALPLVGAALGSQREGEEARLRKTIRSALADE
ncbi:MAG TPA: hypothetical protein VH301_17330 [Usitatibacter sp.]|jgi:hypothetical protein|nr:hypothetical protein [Usitatibacter sp.]